MEVGQMRHAQPVELGRQSRNLELPLAEADPTGLEPAPAEPGRGGPEKGTGAAPEDSRAGFRPSVH